MNTVSVPHGIRVAAVRGIIVRGIMSRGIMLILPILMTHAFSIQTLSAQPLPSRALESQSPTSYVPDRKNFQDWLQFIHPSDEERSFEKVGWRGQFWPAVQEAKRLGRPILLWTMNGHPLGCT